MKYEVYKTLSGNYVICRDGERWLKQFVDLEAHKVTDAKHFTEDEVDEAIKSSASYHGVGNQLQRTVIFEE